jgi:hypothetical protein
MKKNVAGQIIGCQLVNASTGAAFTSAVTVYVTGDGGTQAVGTVGAGACTHEGNGFHTYTPSQAETNYDHVGFTFIGTGAVPATVQVYPSFPQTGDSYSRIGAPTGASISADIALRASQTSVDDLPTNAELATALGTADDAVLAVLSTIDGRLDDEVLQIKQVTDKLHSMIEAAPGSPGESRFTIDALVNAPVGEGGGGSGPSAAAIADAVWDEALAGHVGAGSAGAALADVLVDTGTDIPAMLIDIDNFIDTEIGAIKAKTDLIPAAPAAVGDVPTAVQNADALLNRDMSAVSDTNARSPLNALRFIRNKWDVAGGTLTVKKEDDTATAWTAAVSTSAGAEPIVGNDPA